MHTMKGHLNIQVKTSPEGEMEKDQNISSSSIGLLIRYKYIVKKLGSL